jgi:hypothetical protein
MEMRVFGARAFNIPNRMETQKEALAPTRSRQKTTSGSLKARWSEAEDQLLLRLLNCVERANWTDLAPHFPGKSAQQISERWTKVLDPALVKGSWTRQEDETIIEFVSQYGTKNWTKLADLLPGRIGKQCRERWRNHLDPLTNREPWTPEEDAVLIQLHEQYGNQWVKIATMMQGRSDNHIKNRWNSTLRKRSPDLSLECETPRKRARRSIKTPLTVEQPIPPPNLEMMFRTPETAPTPVTFGWTPQIPALESGSPGFVSPFLRGTALSPWSKAENADALLLSPRLGISDPFDLSDKE